MGKLYWFYEKILEFKGCFILISGFDRLVLHIKKPKLTVFMYHGITDVVEPVNSANVKHVHVKEFEKQLNYLKKRFDLTTLERARKNIRENKLKKLTAVLTFDDGYENNYKNAFPLLKKYGIKATIFLTEATNTQKPNWNDKLEKQILNTNKTELNVDGKKYSLTNTQNKINTIVLLKSIGNDLSKNDLKTFSSKITDQLGEVTDLGDDKIMNWDYVKEMSGYGIEFGGHSMTHPALNKQTEEVINEEVYEIKELIEKNLSNRVTSFAYPTGLYNDLCVKVVKENRYECATTTNYGFNKNSNLYEIERIAIGKNLTFPLFVLNLFFPVEKINKMSLKIYFWIKSLFL